MKTKEITLSENIWKRSGSKLISNKKKIKTLFGIDFKNFPKTVYLESKDLRSKAIENYKNGKIATSFKTDSFQGVVFYTYLNY